MPTHDAHQPASWSPDSIERAHAVRRALLPLKHRLHPFIAPLATPDVLARIYSDAFLAAAERAVLCQSYPTLEDSAEVLCSADPDLSTQASPHPEFPIDVDTLTCPTSWQAALRAAGAAVEAVQQVVTGEVQRIFCSTRPPGHHATAHKAMGFCLLNNIALAAEEALARGCQRVAILDWDVHHGNGTQEIFWRRQDVAYFSLHQWPLYPGTGAASERGEAEGEGATCNCPLPPGADDEHLLRAWRECIKPRMKAYGPDIILLSAGFDADRRDPLSGLDVTAQGLATLSREVMESSDALCGGRLVSLLEGGYDLESLADNVALHMNTMLGI